MTQQQAPADENKPYITTKITINEFSNGNVAIDGFPMNVGRALEIMLLGIKAITDYFINAAIDGKLKHESKIVAPNMSDIIRLN